MKKFSFLSALKKYKTIIIVILVIKISIGILLVFAFCSPLARKDLYPGMATFSKIFGAITGSNITQKLTPGQTVNLNGGQGNVTGTVVDVNGDGVPDGIVINSIGGNSNSTPNLVFIEPNGVDVNGDGIIDYYISIGNNGSITLTTQPCCGGTQVTVVPGQGFDSNGDGVIDNPILGQVANDSTPPTSSILPAGGIYPTATSLTIFCSDNIAPSQIIYTKDGTVPSFSPINGFIRNPPSSTFTIGAEGNGTYVVKYLCRDIAGNIENPHTETYVIDNNVPSVTASLASNYVSNNGGAINSSILTWSSNVDGNYSIRSGGTNCTDGIELSTGNETALTPNTSTNLVASSLSIGNTIIRVCVTNPNNGLVGSYALTITRDDTPPTVTASPVSGGYTLLVSISLSCIDSGGAGCDKIAYSSQIGSPPGNPTITGTTGSITSGSLFSGAISATDQATTYIKYIARDNAGNTTTVLSDNYIVDTSVVPEPIQISVLGVGTEIFVQWAPVTNAIEYRIYYNNSSPITIASPNAIGITNLYHTISGLTSNTTYYVRVEARNNVGGISQLSQEKMVFTTSIPPGTNGSGTHTDISLGQGTNSGTNPFVLIDSISNKLLVVTTNGANNDKLSLFRCNLDGTSCNHTDISAGQGTGSGNSPSAVIDSISNKIVIVTNNGANNNKPSLFRCDLDGSNCAHSDISAGQGTGSGNAPSIVIDTNSSKLLVLTKNVANNSKLSLFRCNLDGTNCTHTDISTGQGTDCGWSPNAIIDSVSNKLLVITTNGANSFKPSLFRCDLDGTNCAHTDISAGENANSGNTPAAVIDLISTKLLVVTYNYARNGKSSLFRCDLNGSNCTHADISSGQGNDSGYLPSIVIDSISNKLLAVTFNVSNNSKPSLFRCDLNGTNCTHTDISAGQGTTSGYSPSTIIDPISGKLIIVTTNNSLPSVFRW